MGMIQEVEKQVQLIEEEIARIRTVDEGGVLSSMTKQLEEQKKELKSSYKKKLTAWDRVYLSRHPSRPKAKDWMEFLFEDLYYLHGDRYFADDKTVIGGLAFFDGIPVTVIGTNKGRTLEENVKCNFGMSNPEGYRKALRLMKQAEKFRRPVVTIVDTPGAYPGTGAEERGQGEAIARNLMEMSDLKTPIITMITGEGGSGGALALSVADEILMLENATFSILSPEGFASILWKDAKLAHKAAEQMKMTAGDLYDLGLVDAVIEEEIAFHKEDFRKTMRQGKKVLGAALKKMMKLSDEELVERRYEKYRKIGRIEGINSGI